ncbi:MAG: hypothetical protein HeimC2_40590 [Candidatus Heimdallarchaeota archaeon LC_2]|nr:MAG: hypothetical protein HeimC2_40590 [Candidatus Heimdallarchaeota archaeon LC_2]
MPTEKIIELSPFNAFSLIEGNLKDISCCALASGLIANAGMEPAIDLYKTDPANATIFWLKIETVSGAFGGSNGEFLGGLFTIFVSLSVYQGDRLPKGLSYLGFIIGLSV